jgi:hypothetical protein
MLDRLNLTYLHDCWYAFRPRHLAWSTALNHYADIRIGLEHSFDQLVRSSRKFHVSTFDCGRGESSVRHVRASSLHVPSLTALAFVILVQSCTDHNSIALPSQFNGLLDPTLIVDDGRSTDTERTKGPKAGCGGTAHDSAGGLA